MFNLTVELVREIKNMWEYKVQIDNEGDKYTYTVTVVSTDSCRTFNYDGEQIESVPEQVLNFVEAFLNEDF